jgi:hypothetical protein
VASLPEVSLNLDDLGVDDSDTSWLVEYRWRFKPKWGLVVAAYTFENDGSIGVRRDFNFDGIEFEAGVKLDSEIEIDVYIADIMYALHQSDNLEIMVGGGLHVFDLGMAIEGRVFAGDLEATEETARSDLLAPLPNLRFQGFYALTNRWGVGLTGGWLSASYDDYDGDFAYIHLRTTWLFTDRFSASLGYQYTSIDLTYEKSRHREAEFDVDMDGPTLAVSYAF